MRAPKNLEDLSDKAGPALPTNGRTGATPEGVPRG